VNLNEESNVDNEKRQKLLERLQKEE